MSKRCCAKNCFNSVLYNKNITYFSFPKNKEFAQQWAELSGRSDLKEKPLNCLIKYYLCSEHFTANCFVDKDARQTLKRNLPHYIALPTIFKNNLQETMQHVNPRNSIEVHNIILLDVAEKIKEHNKYSTKAVACNRDTSLSSGKCNQYEYDNFKSDYMDTYTDNHNSDKHLEIKNSLNAIVLPPTHCRLCFSELKPEDPQKTFNDSIHLKEFITRIMHGRISTDDGMSQLVCKTCEKNALLCLVIIQQMDKVQEQSSTCRKT